MSTYQSNVPVVMIAFNRPDKVRRVLDVVRAVRLQSYS